MNILCKTAAIALAFASTVPAQFQGDVFFAQPTMPVASGSEFNVLLQTYVGSERLGALTVEVAFSPTDLELVGVTAVDPSYDEGLKATAMPGVLRLTVVKDGGVEGAIGTVTLADLRFRAIANPGISTVLRPRVVDNLDVALNGYPSRQGLSLTVLVSSGPSSFARGPADAGADTGESPVWVLDWSEAGFEAAPLPLGGVVPLYYQDTPGGGVTRVWVRSLRPDAPRERATR